MALHKNSKRASTGAVAVLGLALAGLVASHAAFAQQVFYRYQNERGVTVQTDRLPPEAVPLGYKVVTASGDVIKVVPRQLSPEELVLRDAELARQQQLEEEEARIRKWDQSLILRYSNVSDVDEAKRRGLKEYDTRIGILRGNLMSLKSQIEAEQGDAANYTRRGRDIPASLTERIETLKSEVVYAESSIGKLQGERVETEQQFELDKERLDFLLEQAALRR